MVSVLLVLLGWMGPLGVPPLPDTPTISRIAPEECLFYMSSAGRAEPQGRQRESEPNNCWPSRKCRSSPPEVETILKTLLDRGLKQPGAPP